MKRQLISELAASGADSDDYLVTMKSAIDAESANTFVMSSLGMFSTCEISDALIKLRVPHGGYIPDIHLVSSLSSTPRICGPAYTVRMVLASDMDAPRLSTHFVDTAPAGSIIVIEAPSR